MRILFFTDAHQSTNPPRMRLPGYEQQIIQKLSQLIEPAKKCDLVVYGGDLFHSKKYETIPYGLTNTLMDIFAEFGNTLIVPGNHDVDTSMSDRFCKAPIATVTKLANVEMIHDGVLHLDEVTLFGAGGGELFTPQEYLQMVTNNMAFVVKPEEKFKIGVFHASVTDKKYPFPTIPVEAVRPFFDLIMVGHLHDYQKVEGDIVAPGSISRGVLKLDDNFFREVGYALIDISGKHFQTQFIPLQVYPADQVFRMDAKQRAIEDVATIGSLISFVESMDIPRPQTTERLVQMIEEMDLEPSVKKRALKILEDASYGS